MSQNGKYQIIIATVIVATGIGYFNHKDTSPVVVKIDAAKEVTSTISVSSNPTQTHTQVREQKSENPKITSRLQRQIDYLAMMMTRPDVEIPEKAMETSHLTEQEILQLGHTVVSTSENGNTRAASMLLLSKAGAKAIPALGLVATTPFKNEGARAQEEVALRVTALESLDKLTSNTHETLPIMDAVPEKQKDKTLIFLASISAGGIISGKPGKLTRVIDEMIREKSAAREEN